MTLVDPSINANAEARSEASTIIYVCTTCRRPGDPADQPRVGAAFAEATIRAAENSGIAVQPLRCLSNCKRGCSAALRRVDPNLPTWTYVFGDLDPATGASALIDGAKLFATSTDGFLPWRGRPEPLKRGLIARVPPLNFSEQSE